MWKNLLRTAGPMPVLICCLLAGPLWAQVPALPPISPSFEGTVTSLRDGVEIKANIKFEAPASLRIDVAPNDAGASAAGTIVASGTETLVFDPASRRVVRLPYNIALQPWKADPALWGGPAGIALFGLNASSLAKSYKITGSAKIGSGVFDLVARPDAAVPTPDFVRSGGDRRALYYAVFKRPTWNYPPHLQITFKAAKPFVIAALDATGKTRVNTTLNYSAAGVLQQVSLADARGHIDLGFRYEVAQRSTPFAAATFSLADTATEAVVEESSLKPLADYEGHLDASAQYNRGVVLAHYLEDYPAAFAAFNSAAQLKPRATAPLLALFETAVATRDTATARSALDRLTALLGGDSLVVLSRRARLEVLLLNWPAALEALQSAQKTSPHDLSVQLLQSRIQRNLGDIKAARNTLLDIVKTDMPQPVVLVQAAEALASLAWNGNVGDDMAELLAGIPADTQWQKLARAQLSLWMGLKPAIEGITHPLALASLATGLERERQDAAALGIWSNLEAQGGATALLATAHQELLAARRNDAAAGYRAYGTLVAALDDDESRRLEADYLGEAWRKNFGQLQLRAYLEGRVLSRNSSETDLATWLEFLDNYGSDAEIGAVVRSAVDSFDGSARRHSRYAEQLLGERSKLSDGNETARASTFKQARDEMERAIELEPTQPYYLEQLALAVLQRANEQGAILDPAKYVANRQAAGAVLDRLEAAWPGDADAQLLVALGRKQLKGRADEATIGAVEDALRAGAPNLVGPLGQRHATVFFARQGIAMSWRSIKQWNEAEDAYHLLMVSAQTAHEELGLGINMMAMLGEKAGPDGELDLEPIATLFEWAVSQPWSYSDSQMLLQNYTSFIQRTPAAAAKLAALLAAGNLARRVAGAQLLFDLEKVAEAQADEPDAAPTTEKTLRQIQAQLIVAVAALKEAANGPDKIVAGRALALLAETALEAENNVEAARYLRLAIALQPLDLPLRVALVRALAQSGQKAEAVDARNDILVSLPRDGAALRQCAILSLTLGLNADAVRLASEAQSQMQMTRADSPASLEAASFTLARAYLASDQRDLAAQVYKKLADTQWQVADRTAALLDWEALLRAQGHNDEADAVAAQLDALAPDKAALQTAHAYLDSLDNL